ncbi:MAG: iron-sulfur cluster carrier protein ApbC [Gammaproteobacteria bacterium]|nr:iron-sulfur cluster carrier protein ApbC [Gammaproteobacteria bacterium]MCY4228253.1 iron-sulfur cluster carrier protein ApbC [Gammaproteobacteria bacterium]MCY4314119.1 iron-sulfur cluster carrier protein ApbC [Gammaproteobacteria bacterium]
MAELDQQSIRSKLAGIVDPHTGSDLIESNEIKNIHVDGDEIRIEVSLGYPAKSWEQSLAGMIREAIPSAKVDIQSNTVSHEVQEGIKPLDGVKNIIAVASGKGGVGKSTLSVNLALALASEGARVGVLDADIYGPSQPRMLGVSGQPTSKDGKSLEPMKSYHVQAMSIGFLVDEESPMIWRGPMVTQALEQLLNDTNWDDLDYLIIDMPPGTGDTQLTLAQKVPVSGSVIVTTPQDIALLDARKAYKMFEKVDIPVLGVVENMSTHICSNCGHEEHIFGSGGGEDMANQYGTDLLGNVPLARSIRENADGGCPSVVADPDSPITDIYKEIARNVAARLSMRKKDFSSKFPNIVIQQN